MTDIVSILSQAKATTCLANEKLNKEIQTKEVVSTITKFVAIDDSYQKGGWGANAGPEAAKKYDDYFSMKGKRLEDLADEFDKHDNNVVENFIIIDHGNGGKAIEFGDDQITNENIDDYTEFFKRIGRHLNKDSYVHFWHCNAGDNMELIKKIAKAMNVSIIVSDTMNLPAYNTKNFNLTGSFYKVLPDGTVEKIENNQIKDLRDKKDSFTKGFINDILFNK